MKTTGNLYVLRNDLHWKYIRPFREQRGRLLHTSFRVPEVTREGVALGLQQMDQILTELRDDPHISHRVDTIRQFQKELMPDGQQMVWVMSAGRSGTYALFKFLESSGRVLPVQRIFGDPLFNRSEVRTELFYRILLGRLDPNILKHFIMRFLVARTGLLADACLQRKHFCYTVRSDSEHALIVARLFPESRFIYLRRDPFQTFLSFYQKVRQPDEIRPLYFDRRLALRDFQGIRAFWGRKKEICWYLYRANVFATAFLDMLPEDRWGYISGESLSAGEPEAYETILRFLPIDNLSREQFLEQMAVPANPRAVRYPVAPENMPEMKRIFDRLTARLEAKGRY